MLNSYIRLAVCHHLMPLSRPTRLRGFMKELEERIAQQGTVKPGNVLKVDAFLNHQCDVELFDHMGAAWAEHFKGKTIDKILTIEASGIGIACVVARHFGNVPVVFAKKAQSINLDGDQYTTTVYSFTKQKEFPVIVSKPFRPVGGDISENAVQCQRVDDVVSVFNKGAETFLVFFLNGNFHGEHVVGTFQLLQFRFQFAYQRLIVLLEKDGLIFFGGFRRRKRCRFRSWQGLRRGRMSGLPDGFPYGRHDHVRLFRFDDEARRPEAKREFFVTRIGIGGRVEDKGNQL